MKQTSQRSLLFRQNVNRTEAEWVHFLDGYRKALIEFDMKKFGDDWHTAEDIVEEIFLNIVREPRITALRPQDSFRQPRITALRPQDSFRHVLINMCMQKHKSFTKPWRKRLAERLSVALCLTVRTQDDARREIAAGFLDLVLADLADATRDGGRAYIDFSREDLRRWRKLRECGEDATVKEAAKKARIDASTFGRSCRKVDAHVVSQVKDIMKRRGY